MANYVVDASVAISYLLTEPYTANAIALFRKALITDHLYVPEFCRLECVNVMWKHVRFQNMPQAIAEQNVKDLSALPLKVVPVATLYIDALQIGLKHQLAAYDSVYIALAKHMDCPLITVDQAQTRAALFENVIIKAITDFAP